jgi:O-antigen ligase
MQKINSQSDQRNFFMLFPVIFITGPLFTELLLIYFLIKSLVHIELIKIKLFNDNRFIQIFFLLILLGGFLNFPDINYKNILYIRFYLYYLSLSVLLEKTDYIEENFNYFVRSLIYVLGFLIFFHFLQILFGIDKIDNRLTIPIRQEEIAVSIYTKFYFFLPVLLLFSNKNFKEKNFYFKYKNLIIIIITLVPLIVMVSGERMNSIMFFLFFFLIIYKYRFSYALIISLLTLMLIFLLITFEIFNTEYFINRYIIFFEVLSNNFFINSYWGNHYLTAIDIFKQNYFFGTGVNTFSIECKNYLEIYKYACTNHPHNMYLEIGAETGIFTFILFFLISFKILKIFISFLLKKNFNYFDIFLFSITVVLLIYVFPIRSTGSFFNNYNSSFFWVFLSILLNLNEKKN